MEKKRFIIDCRDHPSAEKTCTLTIAGTEEEVLETAIYHATQKHGFKNTPEFNSQLRQMLKEDKSVRAA